MLTADNTQYVKIPSTPIMDERGYMAREWIYFFNDIGKAVDESVQANLSEMTKTLLESADTAEMSLQAIPMQLPVKAHDMALDSVPVVVPTEDFETPFYVDPIALAAMAELPSLKQQIADKQRQIDEIQSWQLLINS